MRKVVYLAAFCLTACATDAATPVSVSSAFNPSDIAWSQVTGNNTVKGSAVLRTVGGEPRTCAGLAANLVPVSAYSDERMQAMFRSQTSGFLDARSGFKFASTDPQYAAAVRKTTCDPQGYFTFASVPDGEYYVTAFVMWGVPGPYFVSQQGGVLMQRISLHGGEIREIVLTAS